jgi:hypothetical protein
MPVMNGVGIGRIVAVSLVLAFLLLGFAASTTLMALFPSKPSDNHGGNGPMAEVIRSVPLGLHNRIELYKNGGLVFAKDGDPWTLNLARLIKYIFFTWDVADFPSVRPVAVIQSARTVTVTRTLTGFKNYLAAVYVPVVGIGAGTAAPTVNDVSLQSTISLYDVISASDIAFQDAGPFYWLNITGKFSGLAVTVSEVGLFIRANEGVSGLQPDQAPLILLSRDLVTPAITLVADDVLLVKYAVRIYKNVLTKYGVCDLVQVVFGLGDSMLRGYFPCDRPKFYGTTNVVHYSIDHSKNFCYGTSYTQWPVPPCVQAVFATTTVAYTDRFLFSGNPSGVSFQMSSSMTDIITNSTHLIIRTNVRLAVSSATTVYALILNNVGGYRFVDYVATATLTYTAYTTQTVIARGMGYFTNYAYGYTVMFIPFNPPISLPAYSKVQVTLELAIPIA